jgi:EAL domain-containing protein (putative c-di-GMP-specific phosphodiesterase class I)
MKAVELSGHALRVQRLLYIGSLLMALVCLQALLRHGLAGLGLPVGLDAIGLLLALACALLAWRRRLLIGSALLLSGATLLIALASLLLDRPLAGTPRSTHLYLLPLMLLGFELLAPLPRGLRLAVQLLLALLFVLLAGLPAPDSPPSLNASAHALQAGLAVLLALGLFAGLAQLADAAWLAQSELELELARAIAAGRLSIALQPQCDAEGRAQGAEVLVRWQHAKRGWVSPAEFVPLAERSGLVLALGEQVLARTLALLQQWRHEPALAGLSLAVNLSALQLQDAEHIERLLRQVLAARLRPGQLKFELTESVLVAEPARLRGLLLRCRELGIATALDDFGTGYASLTMLGQLSFDQLKIDQHFVRQLPANPRSQKVARTLIELGGRLGMQVIAEGVETAEHVQLLRAMGCEHFQGYHFGKPMPAADFEAWMQQRTPSA